MSKSAQTLQSFLKQSAQKNTQSTVYRGTVFELETREALAKIGMHLTRVGGRGDRGIDLRGHWPLGKTNVIAQCKNLQRGCTPEHVRSLIGSLTVAMPNTLGILSTSQGTFTPDVLSHFNTAHVPLGLARVSEARLQTMLFNESATELLRGISVTFRHDLQGHTTPVLTLLGKVLDVECDDVIR